MTTRLAGLIVLCLAAASGPARGVTLVDQGEPQAVVVTADEPAPVVRLAASELVAHVELATGVELDVVPESEAPPPETFTRVFLGPTASARDLGVDVAALPRDAFLLRTEGDDLYILGRTNDADYDRDSGFNGTLYGIYEVLQRFVGVRWLWPGELGTYVPKTERLAIDEPLDETQAPELAFREFLWTAIEWAARRARQGRDEIWGGRLWRMSRHENTPESVLPEVEGLTFSASAMAAYGDDLATYLRRHRLGQTQPRPHMEHYFTDWWTHYGEEHPEWFMLNEQGERGPLPGESERHVAMCVSNPDLHRFIVTGEGLSPNLEPIEGKRAPWDGGDVLHLTEVDARVFCQCEECRAWDGPQPEDYPDFASADFEPRVVSDRYARFAKTIQAMAAERNPDVTVNIYFYLNTLPAPRSDIELNENIYGEFVPWTGATAYYPMSEEVDQWLREQWKGWAERGVTIGYRPNHFHGGYVMPHLNTRQAGAFFKFAYEHGMTGFAFDSLYGHWATKGLMKYMYMRPAWDPEADIEQVRRDYFAAFGPAAEEIERYFDYWEDHSRERGGGALYNPVHAQLAYPPEALARGREILAEARAAAEAHADPQYAERVAFLESGLEHARLAAAFMNTTNGGRIPTQYAAAFVESQQALQALMDFRRAHEDLYIADLVDASSREARWVDLATLAQDVEDVIDRELAGLLDDPWGQWRFRKDPQGRGQAAGWYETGFDEGDWQPIEVPAVWSSTWVGDYFGEGWYRVDFEVPAERRGQDLELLFESVDEEAWVYVNGEYVGEHTQASEGQPPQALWDAPFTVEVDAAHLKPGAANELVVRVRARAGQAGIWLPVRAYFPDSES